VNLFVKRLLGIGRLKNGLARAGLALWPRTTGRLLTGLVRVSFGITSRPEEVDRLAEVLSQIAREPRSRADRFLARLHFGTPFLPRSPTANAIAGLVEEKRGEVFARSQTRGVSIPL
jgi:hypothetical protein